MGGRGKIRSSSRGRRKGKTSVKLAEKDEEDRISQLPNDLINHILSYVDSNVAVQTMVLSKRWVNLWTTLPSLNFKVSGNYINFVRNFLINRDQQSLLSKFTIDGDVKGAEMQSICLTYPLAHNVEYLSIGNLDLANYPGLFNSASLKTLRLKGCLNLPLLLKYWTLPSLTSLYLEKVKIGTRVLEFENLKELTLVETFTVDSNDMNIVITCPKLQRLTLYPDLRHRFFVSAPSHRFFVSAPSLRYLKYCSRKVSGFFTAREGFPCIKQVYIDIKKDNGDFFGDRSKMKLAMQNFVSMLKAVRETPFLELSSETIEGLRMVPSSLEYEHSSLGNLKVISLRGPGLFDMRAHKSTENVIDYLLTNSPWAKIITRL